MAHALTRTAPFAIKGLEWAEVPLVGISPTTAGLRFEGGAGGAFDIALPPKLGTAVSKRQREYLAGRLCAAAVLRRLGKPEVLGQQGRAPVWPLGVAGSISHSDARAIAVASLRHKRLGVDCETLMSDAAAQPIAAMILAPSDASLRPAGLPFAHFLTVVFSAKEALYKAISAEVEKIPSFHDATLTGWSPGQIYLCFQGQDFALCWQIDSAECITLLAELAV